MIFHCISLSVLYSSTASELLQLYFTVSTLQWYYQWMHYISLLQHFTVALLVNHCIFDCIHPTVPYWKLYKWSSLIFHCQHFSVALSVNALSIVFTLQSPTGTAQVIQSYISLWRMSGFSMDFLVYLLPDTRSVKTGLPLVYCYQRPLRLMSQWQMTCLLLA